MIIIGAASPCVLTGMEAGITKPLRLSLLFLKRKVSGAKRHSIVPL